MPQGAVLNRFAARRESLTGRERSATHNRGVPQDGLITRRGERHAFGAAILADEALGVAWDPDTKHGVQGLERMRRANRINGVRAKIVGDLIRQGNAIANARNAAGWRTGGGGGADPRG